jgi:hypothetical protein
MDAIQYMQSLISGKQPSNSLKSVLNSLPTPTPLFIYYWKQALEQNKLSLETALVESINSTRNCQWLILPALALRAGVNPNSYIQATKLGPVHIFGYTYSQLLNRTEFNTIEKLVCLFLFSGAQGVLPAFSTRGGGIPAPDLGIYSFPKDISIGEWIKKQDINSIINNIVQDSIVNTLAEPVDTELAILINNPKIVQTSLNDNDVREIIRNHSDNLLPTIKLSSADFPNTIPTLNLDAFKSIINRGYLPNYLTINNLITNMKEYKDFKLDTAFNTASDMILYAIENGYRIDDYQWKYINTLDTSVGTKIKQAFEIPYWKKDCKNEQTPISERLRRLSFALNIDLENDKQTVCKIIGDMAAADTTELTEAAVKRQQNRISSKNSYPNEYIGNNDASLVCRNRSLFPTNPYEYSDVELATYRDDHENIWCFSSDTFEDVLKSKINPYTLQPLPQNFINQVTRQVDLIKSLNLELKPVPFSEAVKDLNTNDTINNIETEKIINNTFKIALLNGISETALKNASPSILQKALNNIGIQTNLGILPPPYALATFSHAVKLLGKNPDTIATLFGFVQ